MRVLAINDLSCVGKCSLTVSLPVLSACGITCDVLPTAFLSTHTGGFEGYTFRDLTEDIPNILKQWKSLGLQFDYIYSGYLGSVEQIDLEAFMTCTALVEIEFKGTVAQWNEIEFGDDFDLGTPEYVVHCSDGDVAKP